MTEEEIKALTDENAKLKANLKSYQESNNDLAALSKKMEEQAAKTQALETENKKLIMAKTKDEVLKKYPDANLFANMIQGQTEAEMEQSAKAFDENIKKAKAEAAAAKEAELAKAWGTVTLPPTSHNLTQDELEKTRKEALEKGDIFNGVKAALSNLARKVRPA